GEVVIEPFRLVLDSYALALIVDVARLKQDLDGVLDLYLLIWSRKESRSKFDAKQIHQGLDLQFSRWDLGLQVGSKCIETLRSRLQVRPPQRPDRIHRVEVFAEVQRLE